MIKFFRHIRKRLLGENKFTKYLAYAFGEIILVVIGILIALQINTWNQQQKDKNLEIKILTEIRGNLIQDDIDHDENIRLLSNVLRSSKIFLDAAKSNQPYHDSLKYHFAWLPMAANFDPVKSGYELWLSEGASSITNDSIRLKISFLYGSRYVWLRSFLKDRHYLNNQPLLINMADKFEVLEITNIAIPTDFEKLKKDSKFKALVQQNAYQIKVAKKFYLGILDLQKQLIKDLENEIEHLKST